MTARKHALAIGADVHKAYLICGVWTIFLWFLYPIAWGLSEGGNVISPDSEAVFYGILDIMAKPVFGTLLLWGHRNIDPARLGSKFPVSLWEIPSDMSQFTFAITMRAHPTPTELKRGFPIATTVSTMAILPSPQVLWSRFALKRVGLDVISDESCSIPI